MNVELLKTLGQIAGIGGVALGIFLILFRELISKSIFPTLKKDDAFRQLRLIALLIWIVALAGIVAWVVIERRPEVSVSYGVGAGHDVNVSGDIVIEGAKKKSDQ